MSPIELPILGAVSQKLIAIAFIALGLFVCFFGYRLFKWMLGIYGFFLGLALGAVLANSLVEGNILILVLAALVGGLLGAVLMASLYFVGIFVVGAVGGVLLTNLIGGALRIDVPFLALLLAAVVAGIVALLLQRLVIVLATALSGAWAVVRGVFMLFTPRTEALAAPFRQSPAEQPADWQLWLLLGLAVVLCIAGAVLQFRSTDEKRQEVPETGSGDRR